MSRTAADTCINFIENQCIDSVVAGQNCFHSQHNAGKLSSGSYSGKRLRRLSWISGNKKLDPITAQAVVIAMLLFYYELNVGHVEKGQFCFYFGSKFSACFFSPFRQTQGKLLHTRFGFSSLLLQFLQNLVRKFHGLELFPAIFQIRKHFFLCRTVLHTQTV